MAAVGALACRHARQLLRASSHQLPEGALAVLGDSHPRLGEIDDRGAVEAVAVPMSDAVAPAVPLVPRRTAHHWEGS